MASMLSSGPDRSMLRVAIARAIRDARLSSILFAEPSPITSRVPFPARRSVATIDRMAGSTYMCGTKKELKPLGHKKSAYEAGRRLPNIIP